MNYYIGRYFVSDGIKPIKFKVSYPIEWIPLEERDGKTLLISKDVLDWEIYDLEGNSWKNSFLCMYLHRLYDEFFSDEEKKAILKCEHGYIFPLSKDEINHYFPNAEDRRTVEYYVDNCDDFVEFSIEHSCYWCRCDEPFNEDVPYVTALGDFEEMDGSADEVGVRISMWVDTKLARKISAQNGYNMYHHLWEVEEF